MDFVDLCANGRMKCGACDEAEVMSVCWTGRACLHPALCRQDWIQLSYLGQACVMPVSVYWSCIAKCSTRPSSMS